MGILYEFQNQNRCASRKRVNIYRNLRRARYFVHRSAHHHVPAERGKRATMSTVTQTTSNTYIPGVYTTSLILNDNIVEIEVTVDEKNINSIRLINLDEAVATMYPLIQPSFEDLANQIIVNQSLDGITYSDDSKYTSMILLDAITASLEKALENEGDEELEVVQ